MRYKRLTMGSTAASGELTKALNPIFQHMKDTFILHDDLIIAGRTDEEHDKTLEEVCKRIQNVGMTFNIDKCIIAKEKIPWWGLYISKEGLSPDPEKVRALKQATPPYNKDELRSFLCMLQSNKDFIPNIATNTVHLRKLIKKNERFRWTTQCQAEFEKLKELFLVQL